MPSLPRSCSYPGCPHVVTGTSRCREHTVNNTQRTGSRARKVAYQMKVAQPWCSYCGTPGTEHNPLTIDHVIPLSQGGSNARENKVVACYKCNRKKSDAVGAIEAVRRSAKAETNTINIA